MIREARYRVSSSKFSDCAFYPLTVRKRHWQQKLGDTCGNHKAIPTGAAGGMGPGKYLTDLLVREQKHTPGTWEGTPTPHPPIFPNKRRRKKY